MSGRPPEDGPPGQRSLPNKLGWAALALFLAGSAALTWYGRGERSGWTRMSFPGDGRFANMPLVGQCFLLGRQPYFYENWPFVEQIAFFSGWDAARLDGYSSRPYPAFLATLLTPAVGPVAALLLVNWLAWAACAAAAWRLSKALFDDGLAALLTVAFVLGGMGAVFHVGDGNIHLPSFACYYVGVALIYGSGVPVARQPWRAHLVVGAFLAVAFLIYTWYAVLLAALYALSAFRHNRWYHLAGALALALTAPALWRAMLRLLGFDATHFEVSLNLVPSLEYWWGLLSNPSREDALLFVSKIRQAGLFDCPVVILVGAASCLVLPRTPAARWFGALALGLPVLAVCVVAPSCVNVPAYLLYGASVWLYCWLGRLFALGLRGRPALRAAAAGALAAVLVSHFAWSTAHFWGWLGPVKAYIDGWDTGRLYLAHARPVIVSMTGLERTPALFGGDATLAAAGALIDDAPVPVAPGSVSFLRAFAAQALFWGYLALLGIAVARSTRRRLLVAAVAVCLAVGSAGMSRLTFRELPGYVNPLGPIWNNPQARETPALLPPEMTLSYRVELSQSFRKLLAKKMASDDQLYFFVGFPALTDGPDNSCVDVSFAAGPVVLPTGERHRQGFPALESPSALAALVRSGSLTVEVTNHTAPIRLPSWQRRGLPGRRLFFATGRNASVENPPDRPGTGPVSAAADGSFDVADGSTLAGWAWDPQQPDLPVAVDIYDGDTKLATVVADTPRGDLAEVGIGDGRHSFNYAVPCRLKDGEAHTFRIVFSGTDRQLPNSPRTVLLEDRRVPPGTAPLKDWPSLPAVEIRLLRPDGSIRVAGF